MKTSCATKRKLIHVITVDDVEAAQVRSLRMKKKLSQEDGLAVTNHFYLMAMDSFTATHNHPKDAGSDRITAQITKLLDRCLVGITTLNEIWQCIFQAPGYEPECWVANLAKNAVPEGRIGPLLQIMTVASEDRRKTPW